MYLRAGAYWSLVYALAERIVDAMGATKVGDMGLDQLLSDPDRLAAELSLDIVFQAGIEMADQTMVVCPRAPSCAAAQICQHADAHVCELQSVDCPECVPAEEQ